MLIEPLFNYKSSVSRVVNDIDVGLMRLMNHYDEKGKLSKGASNLK